MSVTSILNNRRGSGMILGLFALLILFAFGISFLSVAMSSLTTAKRDYLRARALEVADAGIERAISYLRGTAPDGSTDGSWRTHHPSENPDIHSGDDWYQETMPGTSDESFQICVRTATGGDPTRVVVTCVSTVSHGEATASRTIKALIERDAENVSVWNNVVFGGVGQSGRSINGNVRMRGSIHLLGDGETFTDVDGDGRWDDNEPYTDSNSNGQYDMGEPYTDVDGDGHRDSREPFNDINGNGTRDPALTVTDLAEEISGTADVGNNYDGMPAGLLSRIPSIPTASFGGQTVESLSAKLRVKHGMVNVSGSAVVGYANDTSNSLKETMDAVYVSDGFGGTKGVTSVNSDNGPAHDYDLGDGVVTFPALTDPYPGYDNYMDYLEHNGTEVNPGGGVLTIDPDVAYSVSGPKGSLTCDGSGNVTISGIVYVKGNIEFGKKNTTVTYSGKGSLVSTGDINVHSNTLPQTRFPTTDGLGLIAAHRMGIATGSGDAQLTLAMAMYAQYQVTIGKQCEIAGSVVASYFSMTNVPHIYQVPDLVNNLPPGLPGGDPIWIVTISIKSWQDVAGSGG